MSQAVCKIGRVEARNLVGRFLGARNIDCVNGVHEELFMKLFTKACKLHPNVDGECVMEVKYIEGTEEFKVRHGDAPRGVLDERSKRTKEIKKKEAKSKG
jgi:hypothetical protein